MKQFTMQGFPNYTIFNDGTVRDANGKKIANRKGKVTLECTETIDGVCEAGSKYTYEIDTLMSAGEGQWEDTPQDPTKEPAKELTPEEKEAQERKAKEKELKKAVSDASAAVLGAAPEDAAALKEKYDEAKAALEAFKEENKPRPSQEQIEALENYEKQKTVYDSLKAELDSFRDNELKVAEDAVREFRKTLPRTGSSSDSSKARKLAYEDAQNIRKDYAQGRFEPYMEEKQMTVKDIANKWGIAPATVNYIVNYLQHKLRKGDTAYTPLVNDFYNDHEKSGFPNGAPFAEDGIIETKERYLLPDSRKAIAVKQG